MAIHKFTKLISEGKEVPMFGDGTSKRDYTYITDIMNGIIKAMEKRFNFEIINLGNSKTVELGYLISLIEKEVGKKAKIKQSPKQAGDVLITHANIGKARRLLGYDPKVSIEEGIKKFIEWYRC
jgi:UDP-glucuronate 4-epimerase